MKLLKKCTVFEDDSGRQYPIDVACKEIAHVIELQDRLILLPYFYIDDEENNYRAVFCFSKEDGHLMWRSQPPYELNEPYFDGDETVDSMRLYKEDNEVGENIHFLSEVTDGRFDRHNNWTTTQKYIRILCGYHISNNQGELVPSKGQLQLNLTKEEEDKLLIDGATGPLWYAKLDEPFDDERHFIHVPLGSFVVSVYKLDIDTGKLLKIRKGEL
ncbi:hypothetical protein GCM10008107_26630 [Psychrosphaera saromensis]|uniref:Uncharacterized protein n=1 Tax=Psychrosphaera saromensis TaxID=716813 RepID=A0A2S7UW37_9GAMM|nr:hypothetical protein [Psychrosphaera saromensis]PQJ53979.1 hypothetical protein BTO11_10140 [Psychrosphaera saromensis]GHB75881.1 hypothetical protein GCM10008107_26630 [Psychrosphaera saromensis]GLQ14534.1 hypothetical protein GCM10007917_19890 [Psychrosphaera saromensis]